jgi:hypothetical protein
MCYLLIVTNNGNGYKMRSNDMLYIVDHHNSFTTAIHTRRVNAVDILSLIQGLRFYQNVYINYEKDDDLFDADGCPSWSNQDCEIFYHGKDVYSADGKDEVWFKYIDGSQPRWQKLEAKPNLEEPTFDEPKNEYRWHWHDIS